MSARHQRVVVSQGGGGGGFGTPPTRDQILRAPCWFQGLFIDSELYGANFPLFDPFIPSFTPGDRQRAYAAHRAAGSQLVTLAISYAYREGGQRYQNIPGRDFTADLPGLCAMLAEVIDAGLWFNLMLAGDGMSNADWTYNDPMGDTYGYQWLMANFSRIATALETYARGNLTQYGVLFPGFDAVVPDWGRPNFDAYLTMARARLPQGWLGAEYGSGFWAPDEGYDYQLAPGQCLDTVYQEFPWPMGPPSPPPADFCTQPNDIRSPFDQVWQISRRQCSPWHRDPQQPDCDDPGTESKCPNMLTPRGEIVRRAFEWAQYGQVRGDETAASIDAGRQYLRAQGYTVTG